MKIFSNNNHNSENLIDFRKESYTETAKKYLDHITSIISSYAPLIAFWTTFLYTISETEAYAIIKDTTITAITPEPDQVDIRSIPLPTRAPCAHTSMGALTADVKICYNPSENNSWCTIL